MLATEAGLLDFMRDGTATVDNGPSSSPSLSTGATRRRFLALVLSKESESSECSLKLSNTSSTELAPLSCTTVIALAPIFVCFGVFERYMVLFVGLFTGGKAGSKIWNAALRPAPMITPIGQAFVVGGLVCQGYRTRTACRPATSLGCKGHRISIYCDTTSYVSINPEILQFQIIVCTLLVDRFSKYPTSAKITCTGNPSVDKRPYWP